VARGRGRRPEQPRVNLVRDVVLTVLRPTPDVWFLHPGERILGDVPLLHRPVEAGDEGGQEHVLRRVTPRRVSVHVPLGVAPTQLPTLDLTEAVAEPLEVGLPVVV